MKPYTVKLEGRNIIIEQDGAKIAINKEEATSLLEFVVKEVPVDYWANVRLTGDSLTADASELIDIN